MKGSSFFLILTTVLGLAFLFYTKNSLAKTDLSITATDITFSKEESFQGEKVRVFARVFNSGDIDAYGFVVFLKNGKELTDPQPISVKVNTYDDVFIDWLSESGTYDIQAKIIGTNPKDENQVNNAAIRENYFVDLDTDGDRMGDSKDSDDDNDGLSDAEEIVLGTNPLNQDSDGDKARDSIDPFPLDRNEWQDTDKDGIGNVKDTDDDNDGLSDEEELFILGTNPFNFDSDKDGLSDKEEIKLGTNALKEDSDGDGAIDSKDDFPLDPKKARASIIEAARKLSQTQMLIIAGLALIIALKLIVFRKRKSKS